MEEDQQFDKWASKQGKALQVIGEETLREIFNAAGAGCSVEYTICCRYCGEDLPEEYWDTEECPYCDGW